MPMQLLVLVLYLCISGLLLYLEPIVGLVFLIVTLTAGLLVFNWRHPLAGFGLLLLLTLFAYQRLRVEHIVALPMSEHGGLSLVDLAWVAFMAVLVGRNFSALLRRKLKLSLPTALWLALPYILASIVLPIIGTLVGTLLYGWPPTYASTGIRQLQWLSFGFVAYLLASKYHHVVVLAVTTRAFAAAGLLHFVYGVIQHGYHTGLLGPQWRILDEYYAASGAEWLLRTARLTGFFLHPTAYAYLGALLVLTGTALLLSKTRVVSTWWSIIALVTGVFAVIMSGDRTVLVGLISGAGLLLLFAMLRSIGLMRLIGLISFLPIVMLSVFILLPTYFLDRLASLGQILISGPLSDPNIAGRVSRWNYYLETVQPQYPFGTFVQPTFVGGFTPDSYYITTIVQGTPVFTFFLLLFFISILLFAWTLLFMGGSLPLRHMALLLSGLAGFLFVSALGGSVMLNVSVLTVTWTLVGISVHARRTEGTMTAKMSNL